MKRCSKCKVEKELSEFSKSKNEKDGHSFYCKPCARAATAKWQKSEAGKDNLRRYRDTDEYRKMNREAQRKYRQTPHGKAAYRRTNTSDKGKARANRFRETEKYIIGHREDSATYRRNHPEIAKAHNAILGAVKVGKVPRADSLKCSQCPNQARHYHHYLGYDPVNWFDVIPLCIQCHTEIHQSSKP